jgi:hypothetical protein
MPGQIKSDNVPPATVFKVILPERGGSVLPPRASTGLLEDKPTNKTLESIIATRNLRFSMTDAIKLTPST